MNTQTTNEPPVAPPAQLMMQPPAQSLMQLPAQLMMQAPQFVQQQQYAQPMKLLF